MKLLVVSDVHGDLDALERAVDAEADADAVIFLGDGLREAEDLQDMRPELKIYSVRGNCDYASFAPPDGLATRCGRSALWTYPLCWLRGAERCGAFQPRRAFPGAGARQLWCGHGGKRRAAF